MVQTSTPVLVLRHARMADHPAVVDFFRFDPARLPDHASTLLIGDRLLTQKRTERDFRLAFNVRLVNDQEAKDWLIRVSEGEESFRGWGG